jgi:two-component system sensor histidine kinase RegB
MVLRTRDTEPSPRGTEPAEILRLLARLRLAAIAAQAAVIAVVHFGLGIHLPLLPLAATLAALAGWSAVSRAFAPDTPGSHRRVAADLVVDAGALTAVLYFTGGPTNPFVSLYLVPIALAATALPRRYAWLLGGVCAAAYSLLWVSHVPLPSAHGRFGGDFDLHLAGMWVNFIVAAILILVSVGGMATLVKRRDGELSALREAALRDQQIVELGTLAAGTAHELNTPLSTLLLLVEDLDDQATDARQKAQLEAMREEIGVVTQRLNRIAQGVGAARSDRARAVDLRAFVSTVLEQWGAAHPDIDLQVQLAFPSPTPQIAAEATIEQALRNVLDNAAQAATARGDRRVDVTASFDGDDLSLVVRDRGEGLHPELRDGIGLKIHSTKSGGLGIGLLLSRAALQRFGGALALRDREGGGLEAELRLPLKELRADAR